MNETLPLQYALLRGLQSCSRFDDANIVLGRDYIARRIEMATCWMSPSPTGRYGLGMVVQIPETQFPKPNSLQRERLFGVGIYENTDDNWKLDTGTMRGADDWADDVVDFLWNWRLWRSSGLVLEDKVVVEDKTFSRAGIIGLIVLARLRQERPQTPRASEVTVAVDGQRNVTLSVTDGADIYFTIDGQTYPSPKNDGSLAGEAPAVKYAGPFAVAAGTVVLASAFRPGLLPSQTAAQQIT